MPGALSCETFPAAQATVGVYHPGRDLLAATLRQASYSQVEMGGKRHERKQPEPRLGMDSQPPGHTVLMSMCRGAAGEKGNKATLFWGTGQSPALLSCPPQPSRLGDRALSGSREGMRAFGVEPRGRRTHWLRGQAEHACCRNTLLGHNSWKTGWGPARPGSVLALGLQARCPLGRKRGLY